MGLLVLFLPFTSFPLVARLIGSSMVAPLSMIPMGILLALWLVPHFLRRGNLPVQVKVLAVFLLAALVSTTAAFALQIPPFKDQTVLDQAVEGLATLAVGAGFYLLASAWLSNQDRLRFVLRCVNWSGFIIILWSLGQAAMWYTWRYYPEWAWDLQASVSTSLLLFPQRVTGLAYEPSWLAHQLNMLYLPWWLAATFTGCTAHRLRLWKISLENVLLAGGLAVLFLSVSRIGWLAFLLMAAYLLLVLNLRFVRWAQGRLLLRLGASERWEAFVRRWFVAASLLALLVLYAALMFGAAYGLSKFDPRMARLFDFSTIRQHSFIYYANQLVFAERIVFWQAGWEIFNDYPVLGVGLGNAGFFFPEKLSEFSWGLTEVRTLAFHWSTLPNIKSLWVRLLAETGLVGFALFASWWYVLWKSGQFLLAQPDRMLKAVGFAGAFALIGFLIEGFSVDTFALPYYWFTFGLLTAACDLARRAYLSAGAVVQAEPVGESINIDRRQQWQLN
jgi:hypothetical protein